MPEMTNVHTAAYERFPRRRRYFKIDEGLTNGNMEEERRKKQGRIEDDGYGKYRGKRNIVITGEGDEGRAEPLNVTTGWRKPHPSKTRLECLPKLGSRAHSKLPGCFFTALFFFLTRENGKASVKIYYEGKQKRKMFLPFVQ